MKKESVLRNIVIVGGGSTWTPGLLKSLCVKQGEFPIRRLMLYDTDAERQSYIADFAKVLFSEEYPTLDVRATSDPVEAFSDVDFVFCQIRTGGFKMREQDEKIPLCHGAIGQETCGAGGFAYGMRSISDMIEIVKLTRQYSPDAYILNYTNPAAIVAYALSKVFPNENKLLNICDQPVNLLHSYGRLLGLDYKKFTSLYFGLNHFGWFKAVYDKDGKDITEDIKSAIKRQGFAPADKEERDKSWLETYAMVADMLELFPEYLPNTYLQYYLLPKKKLSHLNKDYTRTNEVINGREKTVFSECRRVKEAGTAKGSPIARNEAHADMIVELAIALCDDVGSEFIMILKNDGLIENINADAMVEVSAEVSRSGIKAKKIGNVDTFYKGLLEQQYAYERLTCEACFEKSYQKALMALTLNRTVVDAEVAKAILGDLAAANREYWQLN